VFEIGFMKMFKIWLVLMALTAASERRSEKDAVKEVAHKVYQLSRLK